MTTASTNPWDSDRDPSCRCSVPTRMAIESERVLRVIATFCATDLGRRWVVDLRPIADLDDLRRRRRDLETLDEVAAGGRLVESLPELAPLRPALDSRHADIDPADVRLLALAADAARQAAERVGQARVQAPVAAGAAELADVSDWSRRAIEALDEQGRVRDDATPELRSLLSSLRTQRRRLRGRLEEYLRRQPDAVDDTISMRDGRLTVLLRATSEEAGKGVRHGASGSGQSVYVEPTIAVEGNNLLWQTAAEVEAEKRRILTELVDFVAAHRRDLAAILDWLAMADGIQSLCLWRRQVNARWAEVSDKLAIEGFMHPLLDARFETVRRRLFDHSHSGDAEPLTLHLAPDERLLVITGPNAGGKTVAIKSLGLVVLLNQCGIPLPVERATLPVFDQLDALIGDEQDLMVARSTFSGRLERLRDTWQRAGEDSLILIDELGSGTDPEEGGALAIALLEELASRRATTVATTHLITIAAFAAEHPQGLAAAMAFEDGAPTFRLLPGTPGESHALDLARRMGLPAGWLDRAETLLGADRVSLSRLMHDLEQERRGLRDERTELEQKLESAETERHRAGEEREALTREREEMAVSLKRQQDEFKRRALKRIDARLGDLERELKESAAGKVDKASRGRILESALADPPTLTVPAAAPGEVEEWVKDDRVRHRFLSWTGTVVETRAGEVQVAAGGKKIWVQAADLVRADEHPPTTGSVRKPTHDAGQSVVEELQLLGFTVDDALEALEDFLLRAHAADLRRVRIVHGHGTGRLRKAVRSHLGKHRLVADATPAPQSEGGNGATIVNLAG